MLTLYFSGTGNTKYVANLFSSQMDAECFSIESNIDFKAKIESHEIIAFCYPVYGSRVPLIMREFVAKNISAIKGKKLIILVTQLIFSGDGARVLCDLFPENYVEVIYAQHFNMPNNICNFALMRQVSARKLQQKKDKANKKIATICQDIESGVIKRRGFSAFSRFLGKIQGNHWQGDSKKVFALEGTMEYRAKHGLKIDDDCTMCGICVRICPMKNLEISHDKISHKNNCTVCYRCVNYCPQKAITVFLHAKPKWQYQGVEK